MDGHAGEEVKKRSRIRFTAQSVLFRTSFGLLRMIDQGRSSWKLQRFKRVEDP